MSDKLIEVIKISSRREAVIGDHYRYASYDSPMPARIIPDGELATFIDSAINEMSSPIEKVCFRHESGYVSEKFMCVHPKDKEEISLLIDMSEANRLEKAKFTVEKWLDKERKKIEFINRQSWVTRLKWVFTGIKLEK